MSVRTKHGIYCATLKIFAVKDPENIRPLRAMFRRSAAPVMANGPGRTSPRAPPKNIAAAFTRIKLGQMDDGSDLLAARSTVLMHAGSSKLCDDDGYRAGATACYAHTDEDWTFYEINPAVAAVAIDKRFFTFISDCPAKPRIVLGDARLSLAKESDHSFGMIVLDAFSSDAIPIHLLTREAIGLYLTKLQNNGVLVFHVSNRYLNLEPVLANLASEMGLTALGWFDNRKEQETTNGAVDIRDASDWIILARRPENLELVRIQPEWREIKQNASIGVWRDDYSNLFGALIR
jgi:hypothetical protein